MSAQECDASDEEDGVGRRAKGLVEGELDSGVGDVELLSYRHRVRKRRLSFVLLASAPSDGAIRDREDTCAGAGACILGGLVVVGDGKLVGVGREARLQPALPDVVGRAGEEGEEDEVRELDRIDGVGCLF